MDRAAKPKDVEAAVKESSAVVSADNSIIVAMIQEALRAWFSNRVPCVNCGHEHGMFEFIQQGIAEHGRDFVDATLDLKNTPVIRVNPQSKSIRPSMQSNVGNFPLV